MPALSRTSRRVSVALAALVAVVAGSSACGRRPLSVPACVDVMPEAPETPLCTTFVRDRAFDDFIAADPGSPQVSGVAGTNAADLYVGLSNDFQGRIVRWAGGVWAAEALPVDAFSVSMVTSDASGEIWGLVTKRGLSRSGIDGPATLVHRRSGKWVVEPNPPSGTPAAVGGTRSGLFVSTIETATGAGRVWQWLGSGWKASPLALSTAETAAGATFVTTGFWGGGCGEALTFGGGVAQDALFGPLFRLDGEGWAAVAVPVLSDILAVSGPRLDDLYVLSLNRGRDGASHFFHLTDDVTTWTPLLTPVTVDYAALVSPAAGRAVAVGCEWPDKTLARPAGCARLTTIERDGDALTTSPMPNVDGAPVALWQQPTTGALHLFSYVSSPDGGLRAQHHVATCP
ncbi:MAG: hypothetical protein JWM82_608 [Myxococcales bacterium]|nr:hypothetical protein [Myxococcales bacterium]